jgi:hypothetical protein
MEVPYQPKILPENVTNLIPYTTHIQNNKKEFKSNNAKPFTKDVQNEFDNGLKTFKFI